MKNKKYLVVVVMISFLAVNIQSVVGVTNDKLSDSIKSVNNKDVKDSYLIEGVPYVGQIGPYCLFTSFTMVFKYFGINTNLAEVLFLVGAGHSLAYPDNIDRTMQKIDLKTRFPVPGCELSAETDFISNLYGLSFEPWSPGLNSDLSPEEKWDQYWKRVKENISNNIPVVTAANPFDLITMRKFYEMFDIPQFIFDLLPSSHAIVIIGYNESNQTVCFHDPEMLLFGYPELGVSAWMNLSNFSKAVKRGWAFPVWTFRKISDPFSREVIFEKAHKRNIQRMIGNISAYNTSMIRGDTAKKFKDLLGIKALEALRTNFQPGFRHRFLTMKQYRLFGIFGHFLKNLMENFLPEPLQKIFNEMMGVDYVVPGGQYEFIRQDKQMASQVLWNYTDISPTILREAELFDQEVENWTKLKDYYYQFINRGFFMTKLRGLFIIRDMEKILDNIIAIEQEIIDNATNGG